MKYLVTNFAYGTGPYLRTTELALAVNAELEKRGRKRLDIIVPWVYGEKQKRVMLEEFGVYDTAHPQEILLDALLGNLLGQVFYGDNTYEQALRQWAARARSISAEAEAHLRGEFEVESLSGGRAKVNGEDIVMELARAPRFVYNRAPSYNVAFGYISEILEHVAAVPETVIALDRKLAAEARAIAEDVECHQCMNCLSEPGTFSFLDGRTPRYENERIIPPTITLPKPNSDLIAEGIYVTVTGIPGLERLYGEAKRLGLKIYTNDPEAVLGSERLLPHVVSNSRIKLQFARSGWGSIWLSQFAGTPFVAPEFDPADDPEIYFNNLCIEKLGLGVVYRGQPLRDILDEAERLRPGIAKINDRLLAEFGTLDGNAYAARLIADHCLGEV